MKQPIRDFDIDEDGDWRAKLACGHYQHVRHSPPLTVREWVLTENGRRTRIGKELNCIKCDNGEPADFDV